MLSINTEIPQRTAASRFLGKTVIVTGAGSGIGLASAQALAAEGAKVLAVGRSQSVQKTVEILRQTGGEAQSFIGDISQERHASNMIEECLSRFGRVDILINAAGVCRSGSIDNLTLQEWDEVMSNNMTNTFLSCRFAITVMKEQKKGVIVNVSSLAGRFRSGLGGAHYASSKAAVIGFTRHVAAEVARFGIRMNVVCPGPTETPMFSDGLVAAGKEKQNVEAAVPLGYISIPQEQAQAILFLASEDASYITGAALDVNGGIF